jgi:hypothetical protein
MSIEKLIFLVLVSMGVYNNPIALVPAGMMILYIFFKEKQMNDQELNSVHKELEKLKLVIMQQEENSKVEIQKLKDSVISLKMDKGINKMVRS